jgi:hypothetical protein
MSAFFACGFIFVSGASQLATKLLHRWYTGILATFLIFFIAVMFLTARGRLAKSPWLIVIGAALGYLAVSLAYIVYFSLFEPERFSNSLRIVDLTSGIMLFLSGATISFAWLFGAIAGLLFIILRRLPQFQSDEAGSS